MKLENHKKQLKIKYILQLIYFISIILLIVSCDEKEKDDGNKLQYPTISREESIPDSALKRTPAKDHHPPIIHNDEWETPVPISSIINTAGGEDSPFIPADRDEFYFFSPRMSVYLQNNRYRIM